jgi:Cu/Ag efflux pump CusA
MQRRLVVVALALLLMIFGITQLSQAPVDVIPEFSRPYVEIQIEALGLSAQEVEAMITTPLEADMLNGTPWAEEIRSVSLPGLASIILYFEKGTDVMRARQVAQERLIEIFALPNVSNQFTMINPVSSANRCLEIGLSSEEVSLIEMSVLARWTIVPRLMGLKGVANVSIWGERERQLQVQVDPKKLRAEGLTLKQIIKTAGNSLWASPLSFLEASTPGTGGWIDTPNQRLGVRHILPIKTAEDLAKVSIDGAPKLRLGDVTTVTEDHQPLIGDVIVDEKPSLILVVEKFPWANTKEVTQEVETALVDLRPGLAGIDVDPSLFRPATYIELAVDNLSMAAVIGAILILLSFFVFHYNWRTALISTVAVLMSVITAGTVLYLSGVTFNMIIIAGLMIALAAIIDNAIVDTKNIVRKFHQAQEKEPDKSAGTIIYEAMIESRGPIIYAILIMVLLVVPIMFLEGITGAFWQPVATTYVLALLAAFMVALIVTPTLSLLLLSKSPPKIKDSAITKLIQNSYNLLFGWVAREPRMGFTLVLIILVAVIISIAFLRQESLLPDFKETDLVVRMEGSSVVSHPAMKRVTTLITNELQDIPGIRKVSANIGRAIVSDRRTNINSGELWINIDPSSDYDATIRAVKNVVAGYPGFSPEVLTFLKSRIREELSGTGESLVVRVYGEDLNIIRDKANEVKSILGKIEGIVDAKVQNPPEMPTLEIEVDIEKARLYNLKPGDVRRAATTLVSGIVVGALFEEQKVFDVVVWGTPDIRHSITDIQNLLIDTPSGGYVSLKEVADVRIESSVTEIHRDAVARRIDVTANVRGRDLGAAGDEIEDRLLEINFPLEYRAELLGEYAERDAAEERVLAFAIAAGLGILLLLQVAFRSWSLSIIVFVTLPVALAGGILVVFLTSGGLLSFGSILGLVAVLGISVLNVNIMFKRYRKLEEQKGFVFNSESVFQVTREQSTSILTTVITTALVFLPFVFLGNIAGLEIIYPMAIVILGGLVTATLFALVAVPAIYLMFGANKEPDLDLGPLMISTAEEVYENV